MGTKTQIKLKAGDYRDRSGKIIHPKGWKPKRIPRHLRLDDIDKALEAVGVHSVGCGKFSTFDRLYLMMQISVCLLSRLSGKKELQVYNSILYKLMRFAHGLNVGTIQVKPNTLEHLAGSETNEEHRLKCPKCGADLAELLKILPPVNGSDPAGL